MRRGTSYTSTLAKSLKIVNIAHEENIDIRRKETNIRTKETYTLRV